jgi:hypothetical protein
VFHLPPLNDPFGWPDVAGPLDPDHPANAGLTAWWLCVPDLVGGTRWVDLTGRHPATLANPGAGGIAWGGTTRTGGWGQLRCSGSSGHVETNVAIQDLAPAGIGTFCWWFRPETAHDDGSVRYVLRQDAGGTPLLDCQKFSDNTMYIGFYGPFDYRVTFAATPVNWPLNDWVHYALAWAPGAPARVVIDGGREAYTAAGAMPADPVRPAGTLRIGAAAGGPNLPAAFDNISAYARYLSDAEIRAKHELDRLGGYGRLRRWPRAAAPVGGPSMAPLASYFRRRRTA